MSKTTGVRIYEAILSLSCQQAPNKHMIKRAIQQTLETGRWTFIRLWVSFVVHLLMSVCMNVCARFVCMCVCYCVLLCVCMCVCLCLCVCASVCYVCSVFLCLQCADIFVRDDLYLRLLHSFKKQNRPNNTLSYVSGKVIDF